jgi:RNA polymerase sigma factor (sigma-70 family)
VGAAGRVAAGHRPSQARPAAGRGAAAAAATRSPSVELSADLLDLYTALRGLPAGQRQAVVLHHLVGLPVEEVASQLNLPVGTVKSRLTRGRAALARRLAAPGPEVVRHDR